VLCSVPSPPGYLRATSEFFFWQREGQQQMKREATQWQQSNRQCARVYAICVSHSGFSTPYPPVGCNGGIHGSGADDRARQRKTGKWAVCACLWRSDACAQGVPLPQCGAKARISARAQRDVAVCLTSSAASAFVDVDQVRSSPLTAHCQGGRTL